MQGIYGIDNKKDYLKPKYSEITKANGLFYIICKKGENGIWDSKTRNTIVLPKYDEVSAPVDVDGHTLTAVTNRGLKGIVLDGKEVL